MIEKGLIIGYAGSKLEFLPDLYNYFPKSFDVYAEPFAGSAIVALNLPCLDMWARGQKSMSSLPTMFINDINSAIYYIAKAILFNPVEFFEACANMIHSQELRDKMKEYEPKNDFEKGMQTMYLIYSSFSKLPKMSSGFAFRMSHHEHDNPQYTVQELKDIAKRLQLMKFFNEDYQYFFTHFIDKPRYKTFFYLDPPYEGNIVYSKNFNHKELADVLATLPPHILWLLSYNDSEAIRNYYKDYNIYEKKKIYKVKEGHSKSVTELLISNYEPPNLKRSAKITSFV